MVGLRLHTMNRLLSFPMTFFDNRHTGDVVMRINTDLETVNRLYGGTLIYFLNSIFYGGGSIVLMFFLCWPLAFVIIGLAALETWLMAIISTRISENSLKIQLSLEALSQQHTL